MEGSNPRDYLGSIIAGKYVVDRLIGAGGFAWVYHAKMVTKRDAAIKILHAPGESAVARFDREVRVLKALPSNTYVAAFLESGLTIDGRPFLALDFIDGITLLQALHRCQHMEPRACTAFTAELCKAFTGLHQLGVAHRDVKPENILLARDGTIKLIDFGLIRDAQGILELLEQDDPVDKRVFSKELDHRTLVGTPEYMAPEQFSDAIINDTTSIRTDTWSDVFSLGVILFEMIAGFVPFPMETQNSVNDEDKEIIKYLQWRIGLTDDDVPNCPGVDPPLDSILRKCLRHDPRQRQPDARVLRDDLVRYLTTGRGVSRSLASRTVALNVHELQSAELNAALKEASEEADAERGESPSRPSDAIGVLREALTPRPRKWVEAETEEDVLDQYTPTNRDFPSLEDPSKKSSKRYISVDTVYGVPHSDPPPIADKEDEDGRRTDTNWLGQPIPPDNDPLRDTYLDICGDSLQEDEDATVQDPPPQEGSAELVLESIFGKDKLKSVVQDALATLIEAESISSELTKPFEPLSPDDYEGGPQGR